MYLTLIPGAGSQFGTAARKVIRLSSAIDAVPIAYRIGQIDTLAKCLLASPAAYPAETRTALALRWLSRACSH